MVSWRDGRDATLTFSTGGQLRNFDGGVYWTLVQCIQSRNKGKGIGEIAKWSKYFGVGAASLPVREVALQLHRWRRKQSAVRGSRFLSLNRHQSDQEGRGPIHQTR